MEQESTYKNIAVIGCGAAGGLVSILLTKNPYVKVTAFDLKEPFSTLLPTGGGRCNISYNENDPKEFVKNYPRGEKFLLSVFSKFGVLKTIDLFNDLGIKTYIQEDNRIFPISNSSAKTIEILKKHIQTSNFIYKREEVTTIKKENSIFELKTTNNEYKFDYVIIATGGRGNGFKLAKELGHNVSDLKPSLTSLDIEEYNFYKLSGLSFRDVEAQISVDKKKYQVQTGDILFTHKSISGPLVFKLSALTAFDEINGNKNAEIYLKLIDLDKEDFEKAIKINSKKTVKNFLCFYLPEKFAEEILHFNSININKQTAQLKKIEIQIIYDSITNLKLHVKGRVKGSEIVTAGGVELNEINSKTMESKLVQGLYFIGEVLNIDGYTGGFNLQNCWSNAYIAASNFN